MRVVSCVVCVVCVPLRAQVLEAEKFAAQFLVLREGVRMTLERQQLCVVSCVVCVVCCVSCHVSCGMWVRLNK